MSEQPSEIAQLLAGQPEDSKPDDPPEVAHDDQVILEDEGSLSAVEPEQTENAPDVEPEAQETDKPKALQDVAEAAGIDVKDLYSIDIPLGDGESFTLGEIKDRFKDLQRADALIQQAEVDKTAGENELMQKRREIAVMAQQMGREPTEAEQALAAQQWDDYISRETALSMQAMPSWSDPAVATHERGLIDQLLISYGLTDAERAGVIEHRQLKQLRDHARLLELVSNTRTQEQPKKPAKQAKGTKRRTSARTSDQIVKDNKTGKLGQMDAVIGLIADGAK